MNLIQLQNYLDNLMIFDKSLDLAKIDPFMANGLLVKGVEEINKIGFGVSASIELFKKAVEFDCQSVIVHHAFNLPPYNRYDYIYQNRMGFLIQNNLSLFGYHFLLDSHPKIGNNVEILKAIGADPLEFYFFHNQPWGWFGEYKNGKKLEQIIVEIKNASSKRILVYDFYPGKIKKVVALSGKGAPSPSDMQNLLDKNIDLYISGEVHEWNRELFREAGISFMAGGHYHSEMFGIKSLMEKVKKDLEIETVWLDVVNDV